MRKDLLSIIKIDPRLAVPVYRQIVHSIRKSIDLGLLGLNDTLPSVNSIAAEFGLARGSVFSAYNDLRASGIIDSIPGKGYFITSTTTTQKQKVFLLLDDFTAGSAEIYKCIRETMGPLSLVEVFFHHADAKRFQALIREKAAYYNVFIILPVSDSDDISDSGGSGNSSDAGHFRQSRDTANLLESDETADSSARDPLSILNTKTVLLLAGDFSHSDHNFEASHLVVKNMKDLPGMLTKHFL